MDDDIFQACDSDDDDDDEDVEAMLKVVDVGVEEDFDDDQPIDPYASLVLGHRVSRLRGRGREKGTAVGGILMFDMP